MEHNVHRTGNRVRLDHILLDELKSRLVVEMRDIIPAARNQIVYGNDLIPLRQKPVAQMRAEKACPACNHCACHIN